MAYKKTYNPCDDCPHSFSKNNQESEMCKICEFKELLNQTVSENWLKLPCKIGDTMYKICTVNSRIKMGQMWDGKIVEKNCDRCGYRNCYCYDIGLREHNCDTMIDIVVPRTLTSLESIVRIMPYVGTIWFSTPEEAESKIKEKRKTK